MVKRVEEKVKKQGKLQHKEEENINLQEKNLYVYLLFGISRCCLEYWQT